MNKRLYQTIVADPPWQFKRQSLAVRPPYGLLSLEDIKKFPVSDISDAACHLYLWIPNAFIGEGLTVMNAWGFQYKTMLTWAKFNLGVGNYYRNSTEQVLFGVKGRLPVLRRDLGTWFLARAREHSRKPEEFFRHVESISPGPRIDVFSREKRPGWDQIGNQCDFFNPKNQEAVSNGNSEIIDSERSSTIPWRVAPDDLRLDQYPKDSVS